MSLTGDEKTTFDALLKRLDALSAGYDLADGYYRGVQRLEQLGLAIPPELRKFVVVVNWPRLATDAVEERLDVEGFRYPGRDLADEELNRVFQANNLREGSQLGHLDAMVFGRAYVCIGSNETDPATPFVTVESPREVFAAIDPRTRKVTAAVRRTFRDDPETTGQLVPDAATLYLPDVSVWLEYDPTQGGWVEVDRDEHGLGQVPVVPLVNRARTGDPFGTSEMADVVPLTDAACRALTNLQVAQETHAVPQRGVLGATEGDFIDADGNQLPAWQAYFGAVWALENQNAKTFQFNPSDLKNFETVLNMYAQQVSALTGLPPHYLGFTTDNPASADAIRSSEARLVKRCERKQRPFGGAWEEAMRLVRRFQTGEEDVEARALETLWRDPSTPTVAQTADAIVKLAGVTVDGEPLLPLEMAWEQLGWSPGRIARAKKLNAEAATRDVSLLLNGAAGASGGS
jgi:hypothetical protein